MTNLLDRKEKVGTPKARRLQAEAVEKGSVTFLPT
jgi:hypothetical protein